MTNDNDVSVTALRRVQPSSERGMVRLELATARDTLAMRIPLGVADTIIPFLIKATADARREVGNKLPTMFTIKSGSVAALSDGTIVFDFELPGGAHFPLRMEPASVVPLLADLIHGGPERLRIRVRIKQRARSTA